MRSVCPSGLQRCIAGALHFAAAWSQRYCGMFADDAMLPEIWFAVTAWITKQFFFGKVPGNAHLLSFRH